MIVGGKYYALATLDTHTKEKEFLHFVGMRNLPTPIASDSFSLKFFFNQYAKQNTQKPSEVLISVCREYSRRYAARDYEINCSDIRGSDGLPTFLHRIKGLGNSIIPDIATIYGRVMVECF